MPSDFLPLLSAEIYSLLVASYEGNESLRDRQVTIVVASYRVDRTTLELCFISNGSSMNQIVCSTTETTVFPSTSDEKVQESVCL